MGRLNSKSDYEELRKSRISENQARLASLGLEKTIAELRAMTSPPKRKWCKVDYSSSPLRRSARLTGKPPPSQENWQLDTPWNENDKTMGSLKSESDYEELRKARIFENQARLASLGLQKTISELRAMTSSPKRKLRKVDYSSNPLRRSARLTGKPLPSPEKLGYLEGKDEDSRGDGKKKKGSVNGHLLKAKRGLITDHIPLEVLARRCDSKGRGSLYDPIYGICCHFCRQKKLCGEEDCKRCGNRDMDQPCIGKTDCSNCHSTNGILCRGCLKIRYGEEMEEVRSNKEWMCPHCIEDKGINPYWICNSSFCLKKRQMVPTGIAIFTARKMGYKSVAHLLMDKLQRGDKTRL